MGVIYYNFVIELGGVMAERQEEYDMYFIVKEI